ncbi:MAG: recombinase RecB [Ignisphaera sp.]
MSAKRRWLASERIALTLLEDLGYKVLETRKRITINGVDVGEVDALATDSDGNIYAIEIKAGRIDVTGIRQAYINAVLLNAKPMVICKGFADEAAKELSSKLGVHVIQLSDIFLVESEELNIVIREVIEETLTEYLELFYSYNPDIKSEHIELLNAIYSSSSIDDAAEKLGLDITTFSKKLEELRRIGIIPKWAKKYSSIKRIAQILLQKQSIVSALEETRKLIETIKDVTEQTKNLQNVLHSVNQQMQRFLSYISKIESKLQELAIEHELKSK